jgi:hypothetical protein
MLLALNISGDPGWLERRYEADVAYVAAALRSAFVIRQLARSSLIASLSLGWGH